MKKKSVIYSTFLFTNNNMIVTFGHRGQQIPHLQGKYSIRLHKMLTDIADENTIWKGFKPYTMKISEIDKTTIEGLDNIRNILYKICGAMLRTQPLEVQMGADLAQKIWNMPYELLPVKEKAQFDNFILGFCLDNPLIGTHNGVKIELNELVVLNEIAERIRYQLEKLLGKPDIGWGNMIEVIDEESKMKGEKWDVVNVTFDKKRELWEIHCSQGSRFSVFKASQVTKFLEEEKPFEDTKQLKN